MLHSIHPVISGGGGGGKCTLILGDSGDVHQNGSFFQAKSLWISENFCSKANEWFIFLVSNALDGSTPQ